MESFEKAMEPLYRYVDAQPPERRDRIVREDMWTTGILEDRDGNRCLIGVVEDWTGRSNGVGLLASAERHAYAKRITDATTDGIGTAFDAAAKTYGLARVVAALKKRAGADVAGLEESETVDTGTLVEV